MILNTLYPQRHTVTQKQKREIQRGKEREKHEKSCCAIWKQTNSSDRTPICSYHCCVVLLARSLMVKRGRMDGPVLSARAIWRRSAPSFKPWYISIYLPSYHLENFSSSSIKGNKLKGAQTTDTFLLIIEILFLALS